MVQMEIKMVSPTLSHIQILESQSIHIFRETFAETKKPVLLYSAGKDSAVLLHLALKAFYPAPIPFPILHIDTCWKFREMYEYRDQMAKKYQVELLVHRNPEAMERGINPFDHGPLHTNMWKTEGLKQALDKFDFDAAFGGARRDEEKSRAKERIFSFRSENHIWDPKNQRPELWNNYNTKKGPNETIRVFPLSNWTESDVWDYIRIENISVVPLYFAKKRPTIERDGQIFMLDDDRFPLKNGETPIERSIRFRTLGCYPLSGAILSDAVSIDEIIEEMAVSNRSERGGRIIDTEETSSMEVKKREGYF